MKVFVWNEILNGAEYESALNYFSKGTALTIGSFDGPHLGHLTLFKEVLRFSRQNNLLSGVISFKKPLPAFKHSDNYMGDISTLEERISVFEKLGFDFCVIIEFNEEFANIEGSAFFETLRDFMKMKFIAEGEDFKCGHRGAFGKNQIEAFCRDNNIDFSFLPLLKRNGERISSSKIRELLHEDFISEANELLFHE